MKSTRVDVSVLFATPHHVVAVFNVAKIILIEIESVFIQDYSLARLIFWSKNTSFFYWIVFLCASLLLFLYV